MKKGLTKALLSALAVSTIMSATAGEKLKGTPIGTVKGVQYEASGSPIVENIQGKAFDGDLDTYFASYERSYTWVGLDLGEEHVIDRVGWSPRNDGLGEKRVQLGVIQGANREDWLDAVPLYIIREKGKIGEISYGDVDVKQGFRYVRYVSTSDSRCNIAELEFYGTPGKGDTEKPNLYQITNLPTVCINTVNSEEPYDKEHDIVSNVIIINERKAYVDYGATVRERGNASRDFPKKPWRIKFDKKQRVLPDAPAKAKKWTLINNYGDKTLMRNLLAFEIAKRVEMKYVPYGHAVDVVLNGEYKGCYQICDQVEVNDGRLEITEMEPTDIDSETITGGYLIEVDAYAYQEPAGEWFRTSNKEIPVTIKSPDDGGTPEQYKYIKEYFEKVENLVFRGNNSVAGENDYRNVLDINSFLQHFIVGELSGNTDTYWSTYMYKDRGEDKLYTGPVWDFDIAFDNDNRTYPIKNISNVFLYEHNMASSANNMKNFARQIIRNDVRTKDDLAYVWSMARNVKGLTVESLCDFIDKTAAELEESQRLNFTRWEIMNQWVHLNPTISGSYKGEVERVKTYIKNRIPVLDKLMNYSSTIGVDGITIKEAEMPRVEDGCVVYNGESPYSVYNIGGTKVYEGRGTTEKLQQGLYIIKTPLKTVKVVVR